MKQSKNNSIRRRIYAEKNQDCWSFIYFVEDGVIAKISFTLWTPERAIWNENESSKCKEHFIYTWRKINLLCAWCDFTSVAFHVYFYVKFFNYITIRFIFLHGSSILNVYCFLLLGALIEFFYVNVHAKRKTQWSNQIIIVLEGQSTQ